LEIPGDQADDLSTVTFHLVEGRYGDFVQSTS
jgi:hypothetical protein